MSEEIEIPRSFPGGGDVAGKRDRLSRIRQHGFHCARTHHIATRAKVEIPKTPFMLLPPDGAAFFCGRVRYCFSFVRRKTPD